MAYSTRHPAENHHGLSQSKLWPLFEYTANMRASNII